jgi:hypothetical protein
VLISVLSIPATRWGAALSGAREPQWTVEQSGIGRGRHAFTLLANCAGPETGLSGLGLQPATRVTGASGISGVPAAVRGADVAGVKGAPAARKRATYGLPTDNSKLNNVQMTTRVNVGGDGAPGPEPEREPALQLRPGQIPFRPRTHTGSAA